jgi:hypothetical protein
MQKQEECGTDAGKHRAIHNEKALSESQSPENHSMPYQQGEISGIRFLPIQREMPLPGASEVSGEIQEQAEDADRQREQVEQSGKGEETQ